MKKSDFNRLRKLLVLTAVLVLLAALMSGCGEKNPADETLNNLPDATETQEPTLEETEPPIEEEPTEPPQDTVTGLVTTDNLNIRSNPSTDSTVITQLAVGTEVQIFERKTINGVPWGRIEAGWINLNYVSIEGEDPPVNEPDPTEPPVNNGGEEETPSTTEGTTGTVTAESLNIRKGPGSSYDTVGKYYKGDKVTILDSKNGWGQTDKGWISLNYVKTAGTAGTTTPTTPGASGTTGTITADALHIRKGPGSSYDSVGKYYKGDKVTILDSKNGWGQTDKGWIALKYVSTDGSTGGTTSEPVKNFTGSAVITAEALYIRKGAGSSYETVGKYQKGDKVTILEAKDGWGKTDKGWIYLGYVKADSSAGTTTGTTTNKTGTGTITATSLYIREGAGKEYDTVGSYKKGDKVTILETDGDWGKTDKGWISLKYVDMD